MSIKITPIGSCRIHNPLKKFSSKSYFQLNTSDIYGFTHSSAEALQQIHYLQGNYLPSKAICPILSARLRINKSELAQKTDPSDLYFVEISSSKVVMVGSEYVQMNYINVYFSEFFVDPDRAKKFWSLAGNEDRQELQKFLLKDTVYKNYSQEKQDLLSQIIVRQMSEEELKQNMLDITALVKNVVFITHCNVTLPDMSYISSRDKWIRSIEKVAKDISCKVYNPTHLMMSLGQSSSMEKNGLDSTHYTPGFENKFFQDLQRLYITPLANEFSIEENENDKNFPLEEFTKLEKSYQESNTAIVLKQLNNMLRKYPNFSNAREFLSLILFQLHDYERVIEHFKMLEDSQELSNNGRLILIKSYFNLKNFHEVLTHADILFEEEIYEPEVFKLSAKSAQALGDPKKAIIYWEQLYKFEGFKLEAASQQALLYEQENNFEKAIIWLNLALEENPDDSNLISALNRMLASVADEQSLDLLIERVSSITPDEMLSISRVALNHNFIMTAAKSLIKAQQLFTNEPSVKKKIAKVSGDWLVQIKNETLMHNNPEQWVNYLSALMLIQPRQNEAIRIRRSYLLQQRNLLKTAYKSADFDQAIKLGLTIHQLNNDFSGIALLIGRSYFAKKEYNLALKWLIQATTSNSKDLSAWVLRAKTAVKAENFLEALFTLQQMKLYFIDQEKPQSEIKNLLSLINKGALKKIHSLLDKGSLEAAWEINFALIKELPNDTQINKAKTLILRKMSEQLKEAESPEIQIKLAQSLYEKDANNIQALRILAVGLMKKKKIEESLSYWEKLCLLFPEIDSYKKQAQKCVNVLK